MPLLHRTVAAMIACLAVAACDHASVAGPPPPSTSSDTTNGFAGFDIGVYPGDAAMRAWTHPASPYYWTGYYLPAPCHRDVTWSGKYNTIRAMGWGVAAIYVGQQDWTQIPTSVADSASKHHPNASRREAIAARTITPSASPSGILWSAIASTNGIPKCADPSAAETLQPSSALCKAAAISSGGANP